VADHPPGGPTIATLVADGVIDAELASLLWLLVEGGVPLVVAGDDPARRADVATAVLGIDPARPWVVLDVEARPPSLDELAALLRGGTGVGISVAGSDLPAVVARLEGLPMGLPDDAVRRLGVVLIVADREPGPRAVAAHYLRPTERDGGGHLQRRPPAVLATWDADQDAFEHYAWGVTPELGDRVGRAQADLEERQRDRVAFIARMAADGPLAPGEHAARVRAYLATEPPRVPPESRHAAEPSPFRSGLLDHEPHVH
jgi:hypothetical protein